MRTYTLHPLPDDRLRPTSSDHLVGWLTAGSWVTRDPVEAEALGDRVAVMIDGSLRQTGTMAEAKKAPLDSASEAALSQLALS